MRSSMGLAKGSNEFGRQPSLLEQSNLSYSQSQALSQVQAQVDGLVSGFVRHATDWRFLAAMTAGGMAYRAGRLGLMGSRGVQNPSTWLRTGFEPLRKMASVGIGLTAEVSAFEITHRSLHPENSNLWRWSGSGGIRQGLLQSFISFGTLKGAGHLARAENLVIQHLLQDSAMVLGQQASGFLSITPPPSGSFAEQFLHAEAVNLQMGAGLALGKGFAPEIRGMERILEGPPTVERAGPKTSFLNRELAFASPTVFSGRALSSEKSSRDRIRQNTAAMSSLREDDGGPIADSTPPPPRVSRTLPPAAPSPETPPFAYELRLDDFSNFQNNGHQSVIAVREGREFLVKVGHREKTKRWDRYFPGGTTKLTFQLKEGKTLGKAVVYLEPESINLYSITNQASKNARKMLPGAGTIFLDWLATQAALQGKNFNIIRVENTHIFRILSRSQLVDPEESTIEACLWDKEGYRIKSASEWGNWELIDHYEGGGYHFLNIRARPNRSLIPSPSDSSSN